MAKRTRFTRAEILEIRRAYIEGAPVSGLAERCGVSGATIRSKLTATCHRKRERLLAAQEEFGDFEEPAERHAKAAVIVEVREAVMAGKSLQEIAEHHGIPASKVSAWAKYELCLLRFERRAALLANAHRRLAGGDSKKRIAADLGVGTAWLSKLLKEGGDDG